MPSGKFPAGPSVPARREVAPGARRQRRHGVQRPPLRPGALVNSSDGYLWIGTQDGLARYDGSRFTLFHRNERDLGNRDILSLAAGPDGEVWIGTARGVYVYRRGTITAFGSDPLLSNASIRCLLRTPDGSLLAGTAVGLYRLGKDTVESLPAASDGVLEVVALAERPDGQIMALTDQGVWQIEGGRLTLVAQAPAPGQWLALAFEADGTLWVGGVAGLWQWRARAFVRVELPAVLSKQSVSALYLDVDRNLWVGTEDGVTRIRGGKPLMVDSMTGSIRRGTSFLEGPDGGLWIGTWGDGLHRLRSGRATMIGAPEGLPGQMARSVFEARDGAIWLGVDGGITRIKNGTLKSWTTRDGLVGRQGLTFHESPDGVFWVGTDEALCRMRGDRLACGVGGFTHTGIYAIEDDGAGGHWVGASDGLFHIGADGVGRPGPSTHGGSASTLTWALLRGRDGSLWVGGRYLGLARLKDGVVRRYEPPLVPANYILSALEDSDGSLWFGTAGGGLVRLRDERFVVLGLAHGLPDDVIYTVVPDNLGNFWMSSNRGVFSVRREDLVAVADGRQPSLTVDVVGIADGLRSQECNGGVGQAGLRASDGRLWFPTTAGVAIIDPRQSVQVRPVPVVIEHVLADRRPVALADRLVLPPGDGEVEFQFAVVSFSAGSAVPVRYRLEGFDRDWRVSSGEHTARYTNVPPGEYVFRVVTGSRADASANRTATIVVSLRPHFYESRWVQTLAAMMIVALVAAAFVVRARESRVRQQALQRAVDEAVSHVKVLQGMLPVCAWCRRVRSDDGYWQQIEEYVSAHSDAAFTHGICPTCAAEVEGPLRLSTPDPPRPD